MKKGILLLQILVGIFLLYSCNENNKTVISFLTREKGSGAQGKFWTENLNAFAKKYPEIVIQDDSIGDEAAFNNKYKTAFATGEIPSLWYWPGIVDQVKPAKSGLIMNVDPLFEDREWYDGFSKGAFDYWDFSAYGLEGHYGIPFASAPEVFVYNKKLFAEAGIESPPETMGEFYTVIDKLKATGIIPIALGAKDTWRLGHLHTNIFYRWLGVGKAQQIGARKAKYTDPDVLKTFTVLKDLKTRGAFAENFEGLDYQAEQSMFFSEKAAMDLNGSWFVGDILDKADNPENFGTFLMPYFESKSKFAGSNVSYHQGFHLNGKMTGKEKQLTIEFVKQFTGRRMQSDMLNSFQRIPARVDVLSSIDPTEFSTVFNGYLNANNNATELGTDYFAYDPLPSMQDVTRNALIGLMLGASPQETGEKIQQEIDQNE